ncbi:MAG: hypothetical protein KBF73_05980 [Flavobacteriales bacterium]|nr:hypothetical protein [Flavobacteriales bacterium]
MVEEAKSYEVIVTNPAQERFFNQILDYMEHHFSEERVNYIKKMLFQDISSLGIRPHRGTKEFSLAARKEEFRYILFRETRILEIKIIYWIEEAEQKVFVTDLFPTKMNPSKMGKLGE